MSSFLSRAELIARISGCLVAAAFPTTLIPLPLTMALLPRFRREERLRRLHFMVQWAAFCRKHLLGMDLEVSGREHLPRPTTRGHMFVSNHQSWADIPVLMEALGTVAFLSKTLVRYLPFVGRSAYAGGSVFVSRNDPESRRKALLETLRMCEESTAVVIFPEGTRSPDGELQARVHPASLRAAYQHGLKIIPAAVDGTFNVVPKTMDRLTPGKVAVCIGAPIDPRTYPEARAFTDAVWARVKELFADARARVRRTDAA